MSEDWGPWIECDGTGCPEPAGVWMRLVVEVFGDIRTGEGRLSEVDRQAHCWHWRLGSKALRYQVRKPPGMAALEDALADCHLREAA